MSVAVASASWVLARDRRWRPGGEVTFFLVHLAIPRKTDNQPLAVAVAHGYPLGSRAAPCAGLSPRGPGESVLKLVFDPLDRGPWRRDSPGAPTASLGSTKSHTTRRGAIHFKPGVAASRADSASPFRKMAR